MIKLYFYRDAPNRGRNGYKFEKSMANYLAEMPTANLVITAENYTFEYGGIFTKYQWDDISYCRLSYVIAYDIEDIPHTWRCYFINSAKWESGGVFFDVTIDLWGSYYLFAEIKKPVITRSNKGFDGNTFRFDDIESCGLKQEDKVFEYLPIANPNRYKPENLSVVFCLVYESGKSSIFANAASTTVQLLAVPVSSFNNNVRTAVEAVGGIYSVMSNNLGTLSGGATKVYVMPSDCIPYDATALLPTMKTVSPGYSGDIGDAQDVQAVKIGAAKIVLGRWQLNSDLDNKIRFGTWQNNIEIPRYYTAKKGQLNNITYDIDLWPVFKTDGMQLFCKYGDNVEDVTDMVEVGITTNDGNLTTMQQLKQGFSVFGNLVAAIGNGYKGDYMAAAGNVAGAVFGSFPAGNARYTPGGDGLTTWLNIDADTGSPFGIWKLKSIHDEKKKVDLQGASCFIPVEKFNDTVEGIKAAPTLSGNVAEPFFACECEVDGVPVDAAEYIKQQLSKGVFIKV